MHQDDCSELPSAEEEDLVRYKQNEELGPKAEKLLIDMRGKISSAWNEAVKKILVQAVRNKKETADVWKELPSRTDKYILELVEDNMERARTTWKDAQPKVKSDGSVETPQELERRMVARREETGKAARASTRRKAASPLIFCDELYVVNEFAALCSTTARR